MDTGGVWDSLCSRQAVSPASACPAPPCSCEKYSRGENTGNKGLQHTGPIQGCLVRRHHVRALWGRLKAKAAPPPHPSGHCRGFWGTLCNAVSQTLLGIHGQESQHSRGPAEGAALRTVPGPWLLASHLVLVGLFWRFLPEKCSQCPAVWLSRGGWTRCLSAAHSTVLVSQGSCLFPHIVPKGWGAARGPGYLAEGPAVLCVCVRSLNFPPPLRQHP